MRTCHPVESDLSLHFQVPCVEGELVYLLGGLIDRGPSTELIARAP